MRRFVEEAQIGGQLQHPGIVPVYELGTFADRRPYFAMKLVKGRTLAAMLQGRAEPRQDLPRFLSIFEQVCQTMAYAHARGVIHRDLKPSNMMVGSFGEVQVMDWGLAKVLRGGRRRRAASGAEPLGETVVMTVRTGPAGSGSESQPGSVLGTPAYMAPEQARGDVERMDERADVFGLGAILCEVLTGRPPFTGASREESAPGRRGATWPRPSAARCLRGRCRAGRAGEDCLAAEPERRPRDAGEVARRMTAYQAGVQDRLKAAELARVEAQARAEEERKRRRVTGAGGFDPGSGLAGQRRVGVHVTSTDRAGGAGRSGLEWGRSPIRGSEAGRRRPDAMGRRAEAAPHSRSCWPMPPMVRCGIA